MTYVIALPCVDIKDKACLDVCPVDCIYEGDRFLYINPNECIDCQACEPVCPVEAIYPEEELPEQYQEFTEVNSEFFTSVSGIGEPGGATAVGPLGFDHPRIAEIQRTESSTDA